MKNDAYKQGRKAYQNEYRARPGKLCECGRARTLHRGNRWVCPVCAPLETQETFHALHKPTVGVRNEFGLDVFALCLPRGMTI